MVRQLLLFDAMKATDDEDGKRICTMTDRIGIVLHFVGCVCINC